VGNYQPISKVLYSSVAAGQGTTLSANGDSTNGGTLPALDLRDVCDVVLSITVGTPTGTAPTLGVQLDMQDACGNWIPAVLKTAANITASGTTVLYGGLHIGGANAVVLTGRARIAWTVGGTASPTFPAAQISLIGR
jgi:hypothetical protein